MGFVEMGFKKLMIVLSCILVLFLFVGAVSSATLNETEMKDSSSAVKNYTDTNSKLPKYVDISDKNNSMPSYLNSLVTYTLQLNKSNKNPVTIKSVGAPTGPSGTATGTLTKAQYLTMANNIKNFINTNGVAPNYASSSLGNIRYESLVYAYARIVNYYHVNGVLPNSVTITQISGVNSAGVIVDNLPPTVSINLAGGTYNSIKNVTITATDSRDANPKVYYSINNGAWANKVKTVTLTLGAGETVLKYYAIDSKGNPSATKTVTYNINIATDNTTKFTLKELQYAANSVKEYVEYFHRLPENVTINKETINMAQFLKLLSISILNINNSINSSIELENVTLSNSSENLNKGGNLNKTEYLNLITSIKSFIDSNGRAPIYINSSLGSMGFESLVYTLSQILASYQLVDKLPNSINIRPWNIISNNNTIFVDMEDIIDNAKIIQSYVETNHALPDYIIISELKVKMPQFLKLQLACLLNLDDNLFQSIILENFSSPSNPSESITGGNFDHGNYTSIAKEIISFMDTNGIAPNFKNTIRGSIRYESLIYIYSQLLVSISKNNRLPDYIALTPWNVVINNSTIFISMDQINSMVWTIKNHVETNHSLPNSLNISNVIVTMPQLLMLQIISLKNIKAGLYQSIILKDYGIPNSPSGDLTRGKINIDNYLNAADNIKSFMETNGKAPNYSWISQGNMRYENLIFMYSQILNYYNVNNKLPQYVSVYPWNVVSNPSTITFSEYQIINAADFVKNYIETNHALPSIVNIDGNSINMPQFLKLLVTTLHNLNGTYVGQIVLENYGFPTSYSETITGGTLNKEEYLDLARKVEYFMFDGRAPNFQNSTLGNIRYDSLIYMFSQILSSYKSQNEILPELITIRPWLVISNTESSFLTIDQISEAAKNVKQYIEINHALPSNVNIAGLSVSMSNFLKLLATSVSIIDAKLNVTIVLQNYMSPTNPSENFNSNSIDIYSYLNLTDSIIRYMDANGKAPDYRNSSIGNIRFESLIYLYSSILNFYKNTTNLPENITINTWNIVSSSNTKFFSLDQIIDAAKTVQRYIEINHQLPSDVIISGNSISMSQFLQLIVVATSNIDKSLYDSIAWKNYNVYDSSSENILISKNLVGDEYIKLANEIIKYMSINGKAPGNMSTNEGNLKFESLIYGFSQILTSFNSTEYLPRFTTFYQWSIISNNNTKFISIEQLKNASSYIKNYIKANNELPTIIDISGNQINMFQFLKLSSAAVNNIGNGLSINLIIENINNSDSFCENMTVGIIYAEEFFEIADYINSYITSNGKVPNNITGTSLGDMKFESMVYLFSNILLSYNETNGNIKDQVSVYPWIVLSNPNGTFNLRTQKVFNNLQEAIDDFETTNEDVIWLGKSAYYENIILNKKINIKPIYYDFNITVSALNHNLPIFTINKEGNGSIIQDITINGSKNNSGIFINGSFDIQVLGSIICNNLNGINIFNSSMTEIIGNKIFNNIENGVLVNFGFENEISSNNITSNGFAGIKTKNSNNLKIYNNILSNNSEGIDLDNSTAKINFNIISKNNRYGLYNQGNVDVNATNNWWGSNNPTISSNLNSDINIVSGNVTHDSWLVASMSHSVDRSNFNGSNNDYLLTIDFTKNNQGEDTSSQGTIPDDLIIYFNSSIGTINTNATTKSGKAEIKLSNSSTGTANVSAIIGDYVLSGNILINDFNEYPVINVRTQKTFKTIQEAIDDIDTRNGDVIALNEGTYTENIIINKKITLMPKNGANVIIKAKDMEQSVILITSYGSGTKIQGLNIIGSHFSYGIAMSHAFNCVIVNNTVSDSSKNIYCYYSSNNIFQSNLIWGSVQGISIFGSNNNKMINNTFKANENAIFLASSNFNLIEYNELISNYYGVYVYSSNNIIIKNNNLINNWVGIYIYKNNNLKVQNNNMSENGVGLTYYNSLDIEMSGNLFKDNWMANTSVIEDSDMILATSVYTCGPAALATLLKRLGIFTTESELAYLAKTDESGTSMFGLINASSSKGVNAYGYKLSIEQLQSGYIVILKINNCNHFLVIENITDEGYILFDPNLGIIEMNSTQFSELFTGYTMVFNNSLQGVSQLSINELKNIKGLWRTERRMGIKWVTITKYYTKKISISFSYKIPKISWRPVYNPFPWGPRVLFKIPWISGWTTKYFRYSYTIKISYTVRKPVLYAYYIRVPEPKDIDPIKYTVNFYDKAASMVSIGGVIGMIAQGAFETKLSKEKTPTTFLKNLIGIDSYYYPDPNPKIDKNNCTNVINPSWEPYIYKN